MPTEETVVTSDGTGDALTGIVASPVSPAVNTVDYEARFKGLQSALMRSLGQAGYQKLEEIPPAAQVAELRTKAAQADTLQQTLAQRQQEQQSLKEQFELTQAQLAALQRDRAKFDAIRSVDKDLLDFADNIETLPDQAAQVAAIQAFQAKLAKRAGAALPTMPTIGSAVAGGSSDANGLWQQALGALREGKIDDYNRLYGEHLKAQSAQGV